MRICLNASDTAAGTSLGRMACRRHLVTGATISAWLNTLMDRTQVLAHLSARDLAGNEKHRRGAGVGGGEAGGGIVDSRARDNQRHAGLPRRAGVAVCHVRRAVLVPCGDVPDARFVPHCDDAAGHVNAGDPEYDLNPLAHQRLCKGFTPTHQRASPPLIIATPRRASVSPGRHSRRKPGCARRENSPVALGSYRRYPLVAAAPFTPSSFRTMGITSEMKSSSERSACSGARSP